MVATISIGPTWVLRSKKSGLLITSYLRVGRSAARYRRRKAKNGLGVSRRGKVKTRTKLLVRVVGAGAFATTEIGKRNGPMRAAVSSSPVRVAEYPDSQNEVKAKLALSTDPSGIAESDRHGANRAIRRTIEVEMNRAIGRALSDASEDDLKHHSDQ